MWYNLLVLAGGGARGILSCQALTFIERVTGRRIHELFQGVYGTSTGAIQAAALTCPQFLSAKALAEAYETLCGRVFDRRFVSAGGWLGPQYSADTLEAELRRVLGEGHQLGSARTAVGVVTYNLQERAPYLLTSYGELGQTFTFAAACRASSAAPTFFPPFGNWVDGGCVANLPSAWAAIDYAHYHGIPLSQVRVLAIGTGCTERPITGAASRGKLGWVEDVIEIGISGSQDLEELLCKSLGLGAYLQLQIPLPPEASAMDDTSPEQILRLRQFGQQLVAQQLPELLTFLAPLSARPFSSGG